jgi:acyl carrier protein
MNQVQNMNLEQRLYTVIAEFIEDWGLDVVIALDTRLVEDLEFDSIDVIQLVVAIESAFRTRNLGFQDLLMQSGRYVDDLSIGEIKAFLASRLPRT